MVSVPLNEGKVTAGQTLLRRLDENGIAVDAAMWFYFSEKEDWKLVLSLPDLVAQGPQAAYREVQRVLSAAQPSIGLELFDVTLGRPNSEPIDAFRGVIRTQPDAIGQLRFTKCVFNGQLVEDALVYRFAPRQNGAHQARAS